MQEASEASLGPQNVWNIGFLQANTGVKLEDNRSQMEREGLDPLQVHHDTRGEGHIDNQGSPGFMFKVDWAAAEFRLLFN